MQMFNRPTNSMPSNESELVSECRRELVDGKVKDPLVHVRLICFSRGASGIYNLGRYSTPYTGIETEDFVNFQWNILEHSVVWPTTAIKYHLKHLLRDYMISKWVVSRTLPEFSEHSKLTLRDTST